MNEKPPNAGGYRALVRHALSSPRAGILFGVFGMLMLVTALLVRGSATSLNNGGATATASPLPVVAPSGTAVPSVSSPIAPTPPPLATPPSPAAPTGPAPDGPHIITVEDALTFDAQDPGSTSSSQTVHLSNEGGTAQSLGKIMLGGANPDVFALSSSTCTDTLDAASGCTVDVTFTPPKEGNYSASLIFPDANGNTLASVALNGTGQSSTPNISVDNSTLSFDQTSTAGTVNVSNDGKFDAQLSISLGGGNYDYFSQSNDCGTVSGGGSCSITVTFTPPSDASGGIYYATININDATNGTTITSVSLDGTVPSASNFIRRPR